MRLEVFDFETLNAGGSLTPYCLAYTDGDDTIVHVFDDRNPEAVCAYVLSHFKPGVIYYAHNLMFDFLLFFRGVLSLAIEYKWLYINYDLYEVTLRSGPNTITLRCSYKLIPYKLEEFYPSLSSSRKLFFPYETLSRWEPLAPCARFPGIGPEYGGTPLGEYLLLYAANDCRILKEGILSFFSTLRSMGVLRSDNSFTCGSIALNHYVRKYNEINLNLPKRTKDLIRASFYGGRCEVFGNSRDGEKVLHFDFKGMYQQCMVESLPYGDFRYKSSGLDVRVPGFYYIIMESYHDIPVLPFKAEKLLFRNGLVSGWYWHEEIALALEVCAVKGFQVLHGFISESNGPVLSEFIADLNKIREQGMLKKQLGKLLINSFYGRLGLDDKLSVFNLEGGDCGADVYGEYDDYRIVKSVIKKKSKSNVAMASAITAKARVKLYRAFQEVAGAGGRVLYCDTDSVFAAFSRDADVEDRRLGEYVYFDTTKNDTVLLDAVFVLPKTYGVRLGGGADVVKLKGVNTGSVPLDKLKNALYSKQEVLEVSSSFMSSRNLGVSHSVQQMGLRIQSYDKRSWSCDRKSTEPRTA